MKHKNLISLLMVIVVVLIATIPILTSCMAEDPRELTLEELLRYGKHHLSVGEGSIAYNFFYDALEIAPNNLEALYGMMLALDLRVFANVDGIIDLISGVVIAEPNKAECAVACERLGECGLYDEVWTNSVDCMRDCPFGLQPYMFETLIDGSSCKRIRDYGIEWITHTTEEDCVLLCEDLDLCGLIKPPVTFTVEECITHCPRSYVEHHSDCYMKHLGECNGYDRTCFEHIMVGLQVLFREIGINICPQVPIYRERILELDPNMEYYYRLDDYSWTLVDPPLNVDLSGRYDFGFLHLSQALGSVFQSLMLLATSVNMEMNFPALDINLNYGNPQTAWEWTDALISFIEILLYDPIFPLGFQVFDEPFAYEQIEEGAVQIGTLFGSLANMFEFMLNDHDLQYEKAIGYEDTNSNFYWDEDEVFSMPDLGLTLTKPQVEQLVPLFKAMEENFIERKPFEVTKLTAVLESFDLGDYTFLVDLVASWFPDGTVDLSRIFYEVDRNSFRDLLETIVEKLKVINRLVQ